MTTMTDRDVIAWAKHVADVYTNEPDPRLSARYRHLAGLAEMAITLLDCGQEGPCATAPGCMRHWAERNRELVAERAAEDWQPIATVPEDSMILLGDRLTLRVFVGCYRNGVTLLVSDGRAEPEPATHWRPLPAPPGGGR